MRKKSIELSAQELRAKRSGKRTKLPQPKDEDIDFSDIPELTSAQLSKARRPGRPLLGSSKRASVNVRIEEMVLEKLRARAAKEGIGFGTLLNEILKKAV